MGQNWVGSDPHLTPKQPNLTAGEGEGVGVGVGEKKPITSKPRPPPCPIKQLVDGYNRLCPSCTRHRVPTDTREGHLSARWRQIFVDGAAQTAAEGLQFFHDFFERVERSRFLSGRARASSGRSKPFRADIGWLMKPDNFAKVIEGNYDDELQRT
jgi:hypothetical protein